MRSLLQWPCDAPTPAEPEVNSAGAAAAQLLRALRTNEAGEGLYLTAELEGALSKLASAPPRAAAPAVHADALALLTPIAADARCSADVRCAVLRVMADAGLDHAEWLGAYTMHNRPELPLVSAGAARASDAPLIGSHGPYTIYVARTPELEQRPRAAGDESSVHEYMRLCASMTLQLDDSRLSQVGAERLLQARPATLHAASAVLSVAPRPTAWPGPDGPRGALRALWCAAVRASGVEVRLGRCWCRRCVRSGASRSCAATWTSAPTSPLA
jgi:hypothetical protein